MTENLTENKMRKMGKVMGTHPCLLRCSVHAHTFSGLGAEEGQAHVTGGTSGSLPYEVGCWGPMRQDKLWRAHLLPERLGQLSKLVGRDRSVQGLPGKSRQEALSLHSEEKPVRNTDRAV